MISTFPRILPELVVPRAGTWIETRFFRRALSLGRLVVPRAGTWIETYGARLFNACKTVVPRAGTWIETIINLRYLIHSWSFPVRERGLKPYRKVKNAPTAFVVPRAGTWIET